MSDKETLSEPSAETRHADPLDYDWAHERVVKMAASAFVNARVYGLKLLKGFGYPDETFGYAQDARALQIILDRLASLHATLRETQAKIAEIAVNCPSCGRHDFGLLSGPIQRVRELEATLTATQNVCRDLLAFQRTYELNTRGDVMPGNEHYSGWLMAIVRRAEAALGSPDATKE